MKRILRLFFYLTLVQSVAFECAKKDCISCTIAKLNQDYGEAVENHCEKVLNCCMIEQADEMARIMQNIKCPGIFSEFIILYLCLRLPTEEAKQRDAGRFAK